MSQKFHTAIRREQLVRAALSLIGQRGLRALSVGAVARRVGVVPSAMYRHYRSKDELLSAALEHIGERLEGNVRAACEETSDPLDCLWRLLMRHAQLIRENEAIPRIIFSEAVFSGAPQRKARLYGIITGYLKGVAEIVGRGQQAGQIRPELDPGTVAIMFLGLVQPAAILWHLSDGGLDVTRHVQKAWEIFVEALKAN